MSPFLEALRIPVADTRPGDPARFVVGQDEAGYWVAVEIHGRCGGLFRSREAALGYATGETGHRPDAVELSGERVALRI